MHHHHHHHHHHHLLLLLHFHLLFFFILLLLLLLIFFFCLFIFFFISLLLSLLLLIFFFCFVIFFFLLPLLLLQWRNSPQQALAPSIFRLHIFLFSPLLSSPFSIILLRAAAVKFVQKRMCQISQAACQRIMNGRINVWEQVVGPMVHFLLQVSHKGNGVQSQQERTTLGSWPPKYVTGHFISTP